MQSTLSRLLVKARARKLRELPSKKIDIWVHVERIGGA